MKHYAFWMPVLLALCLVAAGCAGRPTATSVPPTPEDKMIPSGTPASRSVGGSTAVPAATPGVPLRLSEGREQPAAQSPAATAPAVALADADLQRVLARLPAPTAQSGDAT